MNELLYIGVHNSTLYAIAALVIIAVGIAILLGKR